MKITRHFLRSALNQSAFSLVEVTLAVAIAALAIITLLGLLPQGLDMSRKTALLTNNSNIMEQIVRDLENSQFSLVKSLKGSADGERYYFNDQGLKVSDTSPNISFVALVTIENTAPLPRSSEIPDYLCRVVVKVASTSDAKYKFDSTRNGLGFSTFNHLVAKTH